MFVNDKVDEQTQLGLKSDNSERRLIEFHFLLEPGVGRVVRA